MVAGNFLCSAAVPLFWFTDLQAKLGQPTTVVAVRPIAFHAHIWAGNASVRPPRSVWVSPLEALLPIYLPVQTVSNSVWSFGSARWRCPYTKQPVISKENITGGGRTSLEAWNNSTTGGRTSHEAWDNIADSTSITHIIWPFRWLSSNNDRYLSAKKYLAIHVILGLRGITRVNKFHKCKPSGLPVYVTFIR
jgi:hypothetical protein